MRLAPGPFRVLKNLIEALDKYHGTVTALATIVLASITGVYLLEVREQRMLQYRQLALQNRPSLEIVGLSPFEFGGLLRTSAQIVNRGGAIEDLEIGVVLLCCKSIEDAVVDPEDLEVLPWGWHLPRLSRDQARNRYMGVSDEQRVWLEPALKDRSAIRVYAYIRVDYSRPANPIEERAIYRDSLSLWWNMRFSKWMEMKKTGHEKIEQIVRARGIFESAEPTPESLGAGE